MRIIILALTLIGQAATVPPLDVSKFKASKPVAVCDLDLGRMKGEFRQLAWSNDGAYVYLQTVEGGDTAHDYIVSLDDRSVSAAFGEPDWASAYWAMKSGFTAPGNSSLRIELTRDDRRTRTPSTRRCGCSAGGSASGPTAIRSSARTSAGGPRAAAPFSSSTTDGSR